MKFIFQVAVRVAAGFVLCLVVARAVWSVYGVWLRLP
jgi:hypothetical protein